MPYDFVQRSLTPYVVLAHTKSGLTVGEASWYRRACVTESQDEQDNDLIIGVKSCIRLQNVASWKYD